MNIKGRLIVIEGTDGSGKRTQADKLLDRLNCRGLPTQLISFPRYETPAGRIIGQCYLGKEIGDGDVAWFGEPDKLDARVASLYYAADRLDAVPEILEIINSGHNLILDRYYQSNMGHQGGKISDRDEREKMFDYLEELELKINQIPREDMTIFLYMPLVVSAELRKQRAEKTQQVQDGHESNPDHLRRAEESYLNLEKRFGNWQRIDCAPEGTRQSLKSLEEIHNEIYAVVKNFLG